MKTLPVAAPALPHPATRATRLLAAALLRAAGAALDRVAVRLATMPHRTTRPLTTLPTLEYHAEAGAPEGALYVDGELVGHLFGVSRL